MSLEKRLKLRDGEKIRETLRQSKWIPAPMILFGALIVVFAFFLIVPLFSSRPFGLIGFGLLIISGLFFMFRAWWFWYGTILVVTSIRVIDLDQTGFFHRNLAEARFDRIEDISVQVKGIIATILRLGTVRIQTIGASALIEVRHISHPEHVHEMLSSLQYDSIPSTAADEQASPIDLRRFSDDELVRLKERISVEMRSREQQKI